MNSSTGELNAQSGYIGDFFIDDGILAAYNATNTKSMTLCSEYIHFNDSSGLDVTVGTYNDGKYTSAVTIYGNSSGKNGLKIDTATSAIMASSSNMYLYSDGTSNCGVRIGGLILTCGNSLTTSQPYSKLFSTTWTDVIYSTGGTISIPAPSSNWKGKVFFVKCCGG